MRTNSVSEIVERVTQLARSGQVRQALTQLQAALQDHPNADSLYGLVAQFAYTLGELDTALDYAQQAITLSPEHAAYHTCLGLVLAQLDRSSDAEAALHHSLSLQPDQSTALNLLGLLASNRQDYDQAEAHWMAAIESDPNSTTALCNWAQMLKNTGRGDEAAILMAPVAEQLLQNVEVQMTLAVSSNYAAELAPTQISTYHRRFGQAVMARIPANLPPVISRMPEVLGSHRRARIGYLSPDFRDHSVASFLLPLFEHHNPDRFEVFAYALVRQPDAITDHFANRAEHWRNLYHSPDSQLVAQIRADQLDLIIDCGGLFQGGRPFALAQRMAPVQAHYIGYPNTLGLPTVDVRIVDAITDPLDGETDVVESLLRLDGCFLCYQSRYDVPVPSRARDRPLTFGSFNDLSKLNAQVIQTWATLLDRVPDAKLLMKASPFDDIHTCDRIKQAFIERGIDSDRLDLRGYVASVPDHLRTYTDFDIALDPFPYNGTTTTCEALWMGTPVVTLRGQTHPGRVGASLLTAIGQPDWIGDNLNDYIQIACQLSQNRAELAQIHRTLRAQIERSPLTDAPRFTQQFEAKLKALWAIYA